MRLKIQKIRSPKADTQNRHDLFGACDSRVANILAFALRSDQCFLFRCQRFAAGSGCFTPQLEASPEMSSTPFLAWAAGSYVAVSEQFTHFGTLQFDGNEIGNPTGQYENSSITQLVAGYSINSRFALQLALPLIYR